MPKITEAFARLTLEAGALGIGEDHSKPEGRQLALDLINQGVVRHFFVEMYEEEGNAEKLVKARIAAASGVPLTAVASIAPSGFQLGNSISQGTVIARALQRGVKVHLADIQAMKFRPKQHGARHRNILERFRLVTNQPAPATASALGRSSIGCLFLWGGAHFEGDSSLDRYIEGLPFVPLG